MPLGDSITFGTGDDAGGGYRTPLWLAAVATGRKVDFVGSLAAGPTTIDRDNEGHYGSSIDGLNGGIAGWLKAASPHVVLLMIGTNDHNGTPEMARDKLGRLIDAVTSGVPNAALVVAEITRRQDASGEKFAVDYNSYIRALVADRASKGKHVTSVNMHDALEMPQDFSDGLHPNPTGYGKMAKVWSSRLLPMLSPP